MQIIDGKRIAEGLKRALTTKVASLPTRPGLAIILVGDDPASHVYVGLKEEAGRAVGIHVEKHILDATVPEQDVVTLLHSLNQRSDIHGIIVQFPLPKILHKQNIINAVQPSKDVDGFRPDNIEALLAGRPIVIPGLASGIVQLIDSTREVLNSKKAVVLANSKIFSEPLRYLLDQKGITTTAYSLGDKGWERKARSADILIVAVGEPAIITGEFIKEGAIVIDVGYNRVGDKAVGDVDLESIREKASWVTPVPGGVGPMTVAMLLYNVMRAYEEQQN